MKRIIFFLLLISSLQAAAQSSGEELEEVCVVGYTTTETEDVPSFDPEMRHTTTCYGSKDCETGEVFYEDCNTTSEYIGGENDDDDEDGDGEPDPDCYGTQGGSAYTDDCNNCVGGYTGQVDCYITGNTDCAGVVNGSADWDDCNICAGGSTGRQPCSTNPCPPGSYMDNCGSCVGGSTGQLPCAPQPDCAGIEGGSAVLIPNCGCIGGTTGLRQDQCPCKTADEQNSTRMTSDYSEQVDLYAQNALTPLTPTSTGQLEQGFCVLNDMSVTPVENGTTSHIDQTIYPNATIKVHTHTAIVYPGPSAGDVFALNSDQDYASGLKTSYVISANGAKYALYIEDVAAFDAFVTNNAGSVVGADFTSTSTLGQAYYTAKEDMQEAGLSPRDAHERALAYVLKNAGVSLYKADPGSTHFNKIGSVRKMDFNNNPVVDANGNYTYINADCR
ncbi:MAG TPA: hypothetical protein VF008_26835 [Niastella sp.]